MNQKNYSILLCALLASTFVHELRARRLYNTNTTLQVSQISSTSVRREQRSSVTLQVQNQVLIISNSSAGSALLIEVQRSRFVLLNGRSGSSIGVDRKSNSGSYIANGVWNSNSQSIEQLVSSLNNGLADLLIADAVTQFELSSVSKEILNEAASIVRSLAADIDEALIADLTLGLNLVITVVDKTVELFGGVLLGLLEILGDLVIPLPGDISALLNTLQGLASVIQNVSGNVSQAIERGVQLEIQAILGAAHGLDALNKLLKQLGDKVTIDSLTKELGDIEGLFKLISQLGGNVNTGISGAFKVAREVISYTKGKESLNNVINCLIQYLAQSKQDKSTNQTAELKKTLKELSLAIGLINVSGNLNKTAQIVKDLINDKLIVQGINISQIIDLLLQAARKPADALLGVLVQVLLLFVSAVDLVLSIPYLLVVLLSKLESPTGIAQLKALGIRISTSLDSIWGGLLEVALSGTGDISTLFVGDLVAALSRLNIIGDIVQALNSALNNATQGKTNLQRILDSNSLSRDLIQSLFQLVTGSQSNNATAASEAQRILEISNSVNVSINVDITSAVQLSSRS